MPRLLALVLLCSALTGCELIADFDRDQIPQEHANRPDGGSGGSEGNEPPPEGDEDAGSEDEDEDAGGL